MGNPDRAGHVAKEQVEGKGARVQMQGRPAACGYTADDKGVPRGAVGDVNTLREWNWSGENSSLANGQSRVASVDVDETERRRLGFLRGKGTVRMKDATVG